MKVANVQRYLYTGESVEAHEEGEYNLHSDYAKIEAELQVTKRALRLMTIAILEATRVSASAKDVAELVELVMDQIRKERLANGD